MPTTAEGEEFVTSASSDATMTGSPMDPHQHACFKLPTNICTATDTNDFAPPSPRNTTPNPFMHDRSGVNMDDYFSGPRDILKHSKWPLFMQMHGSIMPKLIMPLIMVACWATLITCITELLPGVDLGVNDVLLTVTGFVISIGLSFRSTTAYERYAEGRKLWSQLTLNCQQLGRVFWVHAFERDAASRQDLLGKLTAMNLLTAFAVSLKHRLRFEPYTHYEDLSDLIGHLDTFAKNATEEGKMYQGRKLSVFKVAGEKLGVSFATSNPRKAVKKTQAPLGNLPLEILSYLSAYVDEAVINGQLPIPMTQTLAYNSVAALNDVLVNTERVLTTPMPIAYNIAIAQITWVYILLLPFQLLQFLTWVTIPATVAAAYIILGLLYIGREIENPFGNDVNDLPLDLYCDQVVEDLETIAARPKPRNTDWVESARNKVMFPHSDSSYHVWLGRPDATMRSALRNRPHRKFESPEPQEPGDQNV